MTLFGFKNLSEKLVGNVMTSDASTPIFMERVEIWFKAIVSGRGIFTPHAESLRGHGDQVNTYVIRARHKVTFCSCRDNRVTLTSQHSDLPLPSFG